MKKSSSFVILMLASFCLTFTACTNNTDRELKQIVKEANDTRYPVQVDVETILDSLSTSPGKHLYYHYTLLTLTDEDFTPEQKVTVEAGLKRDMINIIRSDNTREMARYKKAEVIFHHEYKDMYGNVIANVVIAPEDYRTQE